MPVCSFTLLMLLLMMSKRVPWTMLCGQANAVEVSSLQLESASEVSWRKYNLMDQLYEDGREKVLEEFSQAQMLSTRIRWQTWWQHGNEGLCLCCLCVHMIFGPKSRSRIGAWECGANQGRSGELWVSHQPLASRTFNWIVVLLQLFVLQHTNQLTCNRNHFSSDYERQLTHLSEFFCSSAFLCLFVCR